MRLVELHLKAFGPFTDQVLPLGSGGQRLVLVHGLNAAGKSSALRAISALRFGIPPRTTDAFLHDYQQMRVGGVFVDSQGNLYSLMRRKGTGVTLKFADFGNGGRELPDPVPPAVNGLLTGGLSVKDYEGMFGLDHATLRAGGITLARGEGEIGAALFEASSGVADVSKVLGELDAAARKFFMPAAQARNGRINLALAEFKAQADNHKSALVRPAKWDAIHKDALGAAEALAAVKSEHAELIRQQLLIKELIAVAPTLDSLALAREVLRELADVPLLPEQAPSERAAAEAGLSEAQAVAATNETKVAQARDLIDSIELDTGICEVGQSVTRLHAAAALITQLREHHAAAQADIESRKRDLIELASHIDPGTEADEVVRQAPASARKAQITECVADLEEAERALLQHRQAAPSATADVQDEGKAIPDASLQTALRVALSEVTRSETALARLRALPAEIRASERRAATALAKVRLPDETAARRVQPLLGAAVDRTNEQLTALATKRAEKVERLEQMAGAAEQRQAAINVLLAHGPVPTHDDVRSARARRQAGWALVRGTYIERTNPDLEGFTHGQPLPDVYEGTVAAADQVIDELASDTERASSLEAKRQELADIQRDEALRHGEIRLIDTEVAEVNGVWEQLLAKAGIPTMPPADLRDWQGLLDKSISELDALQTKRDELEQCRLLEADLAGKLRQAINSLDQSTVAAAESLPTLLAVAEDAKMQVDALKAARNTAAGQALQRQQQGARHLAKNGELADAVTAARVAFEVHLAGHFLSRDATAGMVKARLEEFDRLVAASASVHEAEDRLATHAASLTAHRETAGSIAEALSEPPPSEINLAAERWSARLERAQQRQSELNLAKQSLVNEQQKHEDNLAKVGRHEATIKRLIAAAGVTEVSGLPQAEENSRRKRQAARDEGSAAEILARASRRSVEALVELLAGRGQEVLRAEEARIEHELSEVSSRLEKARVAEEEARRALDDIDSSDAAAAAADAMARAAATVRHTLPLQIRSRLAHALLRDAVRRFKERSQAPMLKAASKYFVKITGGEFVGLFSDDSAGTPVIAANRPDGTEASIEAMSEGTRDQLYLALRLAALELQRERGVHLPVLLDDVLVTSDDARAGCIFKALEEYSGHGQVIVFTHHQHLVEVARRSVSPDALAVVELSREVQGADGGATAVAPSA